MSRVSRKRARVNQVSLPALQLDDHSALVIVNVLNQLDSLTRDVKRVLLLAEEHFPHRPPGAAMSVAISDRSAGGAAPDRAVVPCPRSPTPSESEKFKKSIEEVEAYCAEIDREEMVSPSLAY